MTDLKLGQELIWPMGGGFKARLRVTEIDPFNQTGEMQMIEVIAPPPPSRYARGHAPCAQVELGICVLCTEPVDKVKSKTDSLGRYYRHSRRKQPQTARERWFCSVCGRKGEWYEFDGSGRGVECQP